MIQGSPLQAKDLISLSTSQIAALRALTVSKRQEELGGSFVESLDTWSIGPRDHILGVGLLHNDTPIGLTLFKRPPASPKWVTTDAASIHGLKIALPWQGQGWGHSALRQTVSVLCKTWPETRHLMLSVDADNVTALSIYRAFGMSDSGAIHQGRIGMEHHMAIALGTQRENAT